MALIRSSLCLLQLSGDHEAVQGPNVSFADVRRDVLGARPQGIQSGWQQVLLWRPLCGGPEAVLPNRALAAFPFQLLFST